MKNEADVERAFWGTLRTSGAAKPPFPNCWPSMKAPEQDALLEDIEDWVRWAVDRYELDYRTIPPCWACHGALVEELSALHSAWLTVFQPSSRGDAPMTWHDGFAKARLRLADWVARSGCRPGEHRGGPADSEGRPNGDPPAYRTGAGLEKPDPKTGTEPETGTTPKA